jgi:cell wall-associated NlpC family hydrolase
MTEADPKPKLDRRRHASRGDIAAAALRDRVKADRYVDGRVLQVLRPVLALRREPSFNAALDTEILFGERVTVYEEREGWAWLQVARDGYVGYARIDGLTDQLTAPTHRVRAVGTFLYPRPDIKSPPLFHLPLNAELTVVRDEERFLELARGGFVMAHHTARFDEPARDFVDIAERFDGTPYLWGGKTRLGLDCSGLLQIALEAAGYAAPRDSDMQEAEVGETVLVPADLAAEGALRRGDLVFWPGHVGIMTDGVMLLHANGHHMATVVEPLFEAAQRIERQTGKPIRAIRRLPALGRGSIAGPA